MLDGLIDKIIRHPKLSTTLGVLIVVVLGGTIWWFFVWESPQYVFQGMLADNLATTSVTKTASAGSGTQGVSQLVRLEMGNTNAVDWLVTAKENNASVTSESIGTVNAGYIRYTHITAAQASKNSKPYSFSSVLNVWAKGDGKTDTSLSQLFDNTLLDINSAPIPPIGDLPAAEQQNLISYMNNQDIYSPSYKNVKKEKVNGREVYTYTVSVRLGPYVRLMQAFAHDLNIHSLDSVNPNQFSSTKPITMTVSVDIASHQLVRVTYPASGFMQSYIDWGLTAPIVMPHTTVTTTELQNRINALSKSV